VDTAKQSDNFPTSHATSANRPFRCFTALPFPGMKTLQSFTIRKGNTRKYNRMCVQAKCSRRRSEKIWSQVGSNAGILRMLHIPIPHAASIFVVEAQKYFIGTTILFHIVLFLYRIMDSGKSSPSSSKYPAYEGDVLRDESRHSPAVSIPAGVSSAIARPVGLLAQGTKETEEVVDGTGKRDDDGDKVEVDQVMRIHAVSTPLKDVRKVKKDGFHDSPRLKKRQSMIQKAMGGNRTPVQEEKVIFHTLPAMTNAGRVVQVPRNLQADVDRPRALRRSNTAGGSLRRNFSSIGKGGGGLIRSFSGHVGEKSSSKSSSSSNSSQSSQSRSNSSHTPSKLRESLHQLGKSLSVSCPKETGYKGDVLRDESCNSSPAGATSTMASPVQQTYKDEVLRDITRDLPSLSSPAGSSSLSTPASKERLNSTRNKFKSSVRAMMFARNMKQNEEQDAQSTPTTLATSTPQAATRSEGRIVVEPLTPEKLNGRGNNFFFSVVLSQKIRACGMLGEDSTRLRVPVLTLGEYSGPVSKSRWYVDAFTLPHNAVRRECMDMYELIIGIAKLSAPDDVMSDDIISFYEWWEVATAFFQRYLDVERKVLIPWVDAIGNADSHVRMALRKMRGMKESLKDLLAKIDGEWTKRHTQSAEITFSAVYTAVDAFVPRFMNYLADQEVLLPMLVKHKYTIDDRVKMERELVNAFMRDDRVNNENSTSNHNIVLLVRWMANPRQLRAWVSKYLTSPQRQNFPTWFRTFQMEHERFVTNIKHRTGSSSKTE